MTDTKNILVTDSDCHWYVISLDKELNWDKWCKDNVNDGELPDYATQISGSPSLVIFGNFKIR